MQDIRTSSGRLLAALRLGLMVGLLLRAAVLMGVLKTQAGAVQC